MAQQNVEVLKNYIGGEWVEAKSEQSEPVFNPASGEELARVPLSGREDVDRAVAAAQEAFAGWSKTPVPRRARILLNINSCWLITGRTWREPLRWRTEKAIKKLTARYSAVLSVSNSRLVRLR